MPHLKKYSVFVYIFVMLSVSCTTEQHKWPADDVEQETYVFLGGKLEDLIAEGFQYKAPGYCFRRIQKTVPKKWWRYAVENIYYNLPESEDFGFT